MTTPTTPETARHQAGLLDASMLWGKSRGAEMLRDLADQVEALTSELAKSQPVEPVACENIAQCKRKGGFWKPPCKDCPAMQPVEQGEPVARVTGYHSGRCVIEPLDRTSVFPVGMAVYAQPVRPMSDDLAALVSRLARALGKANPSHDLPVKAMRYLADNDLLNGPWLRSKEYGATDEDIATLVAHIKGATE